MPFEPFEETQVSEVTQWRNFLQSEFTEVQTNARSPRGWTFDIDDAPELKQEALEKTPRLKRALQFLDEHVHPLLIQSDREALKRQASRRRIAWLAIWPGIGAVVLAILQLIFSHLLPGLVGLIAVTEVLTVVLALLAVIMGFRWQSHHRWLTCRQAAERLRNLKFQSLGWHELWCDEAAWRNFVLAEIKTISGLTDHDAERWATEDDVTPEVVTDPQCHADPSELRALCDYYLFKRLRYQKAYFDRQAKKADVHSWAARWKVSLWVFFASVAIVFLHGIIAVSIALFFHAEDNSTSEQSEAGHVAAAEAHENHEHANADNAAHAHGHNDWLHNAEIALVGLAALLPVIGFGIRAWSAAFEFPRSRNLFRSKSFALNELIEFLEHDSGDLMRTMHHISHTEHFFLAEHREWCRLQIESEWYV